jgi:methionyl-tRNA formyltransferase
MGQQASARADVRAEDASGKRYLVAGNRPWSRLVFDEVISRLPGEWRFARTSEEIDTRVVQQFDPRYVFFLHWSDKIPAELVGRFECVCFHMTDVPYGRGGSPLQNLIAAGHRSTVLTALRMTDEFDAGPVYEKVPLSLEGSAEEIYLRASHLAAEMVQRIAADETVPVPQAGAPVVFKRRDPAQSKLPESGTLLDAFDFIRMLDAEGYPLAFIEYGDYRLVFGSATLRTGRVQADVTILPREGAE